MSFQVREGFWREAIAQQGSVTPKVCPLVLVFGLIASAICALAWLVERVFQQRLGLEITPFEFAGAALGLLLVLRTNAGYERWWEARKLWGAIVNQTRNLAVSATCYGPASSEWRETVVRWTAVFPHVARVSLRGQAPSAEVANLVGAENAALIAKADHMPSYVLRRLGELLQDGCDTFEMDRFAFMQLDRERALLMDHIGACERILKTPLPKAYSIKIRRFILLFLLTLPLALLHRMSGEWLIPLITMLAAYPLLSLDQIGIELENPFSTKSLSHLPLDEISATVERNLRQMWREKQSESRTCGTRVSRHFTPETEELAVGPL